MEIVDIKKVLDDHGMIWWLDSGSLLGMIRDGKFLKQDKDIDIGILNTKNEENIQKMISDFASMGFRIVRFQKNGFMFKCKLIPNKKNNFKYTLDIQFYICYGDKYVCPQMVQKKNLSIIQKIVVKYIQLKKCNANDIKCSTFRTSLNYFLCNLLSEKDYSINFSKKIQNMYNSYLWSVPVEYLNDFFCVNNFNVFKKVEKYLEYRYGNWKVPVLNWSYVRDDGGLRLISDEEIENIIRGR